MSDGPDDQPVVFDAADLTWTTGPLRNASVIVGDFTVRIGEDGSEVILGPDAIVIPVDGPVLEEVGGEGYARKEDGATSWATVDLPSGVFLCDAAPLDPDGTEIDPDELDGSLADVHDDPEGEEGQDTP